MEPFNPINGNFSAIIVNNDSGRIMGAMRINEGMIECTNPRYLENTITISGKEIPHKNIDVTSCYDYHERFITNNSELFRLLKNVGDCYLTKCVDVVGEYNLSRRTKIEKVIFNNPATIVIWKDGTKTIVKCGEDDVFDPEKGLALCFMKRILGNKGNFNNVIREWVPEDSELSESPIKSIKHMADVLRDSLSTVNMGLVGVNDIYLGGKED